jgi:type II secretory pathway component PulM
MEAFIERLRSFWEGLHERERRLLSGLVLVLGLIVLGLPLGLIVIQNQDLQSENDELRALLTQVEEQRPMLTLQELSRKTAETRYKNVTPPLGSYLESEAKKQGLALSEVTEQPEKTEGAFHRRAVRAAINDVGLTGIINLLSGIVSSPHPVAVDHIQIEHYQSGDKYRFKLGVLTFDRKAAKAAAAKPGAAKKETDG